MTHELLDEYFELEDQKSRERLLKEINRNKASKSEVNNTSSKITDVSRLSTDSSVAVTVANGGKGRGKVKRNYKVITEGLRSLFQVYYQLL